MARVRGALDDSVTGRVADIVVVHGMIGIQVNAERITVSVDGNKAIDLPERLSL